ncbi:MAG: hypothetical protein HXX81_05920 [Campylobacterales bacterium]|nr:hypothetical protein [Campylobacterales bacterium]
MNTIFHPFEPIIYNSSKTLILGTFPSIKSCQNCFYYSHPKNQFWKIFESIYQTNLNSIAKFGFISLKLGQIKKFLLNH